MQLDYGKRGGTSATAGKRASVYEVTLHDGRTERVRKFKVTAADAWCACYPDRACGTGLWTASSFIRADRREVELQIDRGSGCVCPAKRVA